MELTKGKILSLIVAVALLIGCRPHSKHDGTLPSTVGNNSGRASIANSKEYFKFATEQDIKAYFQKAYGEFFTYGGQIQTVKAETNRYCVVLVDPYSGVVGTKAYCYVERPNGWLLCGSVREISGIFPKNITAKQVGDSVALIDNRDAAILAEPSTNTEAPGKILHMFAF